LPGWTALDPTNVDLTGFDLDAIAREVRGTADAVASRALDVAKDATYVAVGLGLLNFQRLQVRRRELERALHR
jgi:hypothetical protein